MKKSELEKKPKRNKKKNFLPWFFLAIITFITIPFLIAFLVLQKTSTLTTKYSNEIKQNLFYLFKEENFKENFKTLFLFTYWLTDARKTETSFGKGIKELYEIWENQQNRTIKNPTKTVKKEIEVEIENEKNFIENSKTNLLEPYKHFCKINKKDSFKMFMDNYPTNKEKEEKFIDSFFYLFFFRFWHEKWKNEYVNLFSEENKNILFDHSNLLFSFLPEKSQKLMWKTFSMNIIALFTPTTQKWLVKICIPYFSKEEKTFSELIELICSCFWTETKKKEKYNNYITELENNNVSENDIQNYNNTIKKYESYKEEFIKTTIIKNSLRENAYEEFKKTLLILLFFCWLKTETNKNVKIVSLLTKENKNTILQHFVFFFLLLTEEKKKEIWKKTFPEDNVV